MDLRAAILSVMPQSTPQQCPEIQQEMDTKHEGLRKRSSQISCSESTSSITDDNSINERDLTDSSSNDLNTNATRDPPHANTIINNSLRASAPAHKKIKESPLSSDAIFKQSHAGLFNLCIVVLVAVNSRLIIENLMKYGLLIQTGFWFSSKSLRDWPLLMCGCHSSVLSGLVLMVYASTIWLKLVSYAHTNHDLRALSIAGEKTQASVDTSKVDYPGNINLGNLVYFMVAPTLCYQTSYPCTTHIRKSWVLRQLGKLVIFTGVMGFIVEQVRHCCMLNIVAELVRFGDREFYKDWWNAKTIEEYWRMWNMPVHKWMVRHVYFPCLRQGISKNGAIIISFSVSAIFHEVPLVVLTNYLQNKFQNTMVGNMIFWFFFSILGQPMCVLLYYHDVINQEEKRK